ncbi:MULTISPECIES: TraM recognition domain-containing protein [Ferrimicrobium]|uniref:TraM recognition domain-containing protein n=2 Tax=Acidimicrobiaceae TaxID=84994 RepID=UPI0023F38065|nr:MULTISPECIES: TraM recognition domain-containing protein [Ferrimicrobium]
MNENFLAKTRRTFKERYSERKQLKREGSQSKTTDISATSQDIAVVYADGHPNLPPRGWEKGTKIALGRLSQFTPGRAWFPHALVIGQTGSGKTTLLRPLIGRWAGPRAVMSTKGDIVPDAYSAGTPGTIHLVTPDGRSELDADGKSRLSALEAAGWTVRDVRWDPAIWAAQATESKLSQRASTLADCMSDVVGQDSGNTFWSKASAGFLTSILLLEGAAIRAKADSWEDLWIDASAVNNNGSSQLFARRKKDPGMSRIMSEISATNLGHLYDRTVNQPFPDLTPTETSAAEDVLQMAHYVKTGNVTTLSSWQTMLVALKAYKIGDTSGRAPLDVGAWGRSANDLLVVVVPSIVQATWTSPMAALALALWTEASSNATGNHLIVLDEMASLAPVPNIESWTAQGRGLGVHVVGVLQHEDQATIWSRGNNTAGWIVNTWPLALVASGTPAIGLATHLATGSGQHDVQKRSTTYKPGQGWFAPQIQEGTTHSTARQDRIESDEVFSDTVRGAWRVVDGGIGPWATGIQKPKR